MEAEGLLGIRLVLEDGVLEVFSHGVSSLRLTREASGWINRMPWKKDGLAITIRAGDEGAMAAFDAEQAPAAEALLAAFEAGRG